MSEYRPTILVFCHISNPRSITGAEKLLLFFCQQLSIYARCMMVFPQEGMITSAARRQGMEVIVQPYPLLYGIYTPYQGLLEDAANLKNDPAYRELLQLMEGLAPDIILVNTCVNLLPAMAAKAYGIPVIWKITEMITNSSNTSLSLQLIHQYSDWIVTISQATSWCFGGRDNVTIMPPSFDNQSLLDHHLIEELRLGWRREHQLYPEHRCIGYISSYIYKDKGLLPFINMAITLCKEHPEARYLIVGSPVDQHYYDACIARVKRSGYASRFVFIPFVEQVQQAYSMMDILVVPSIIKEGFGMTAMEGMLHRKPVIAFSSGGLIELMEQTGNGTWMVECKDQAGLVNKVKYLLTHPEEAATLGQLNHERVVAGYGPQAYQQRMADMVQQWRQLHPEWFAPSIREFRVPDALLAIEGTGSVQDETNHQVTSDPFPESETSLQHPNTSSANHELAHHLLDSAAPPPTPQSPTSSASQKRPILARKLNKLSKRSKQHRKRRTAVRNRRGKKQRLARRRKRTILRKKRQSRLRKRINRKGNGR